MHTINDEGIKVAVHPRYGDLAAVQSYQILPKSIISTDMTRQCRNPTSHNHTFTIVRQ